MDLGSGRSDDSGAGRFAADCARLAELLRDAVNALGFDQVLDRSPVGTSATVPRRIHQMPNLDVAVIALRRDGRPRAVANLLHGPGCPRGTVVPVEPEHLGTDQVRWRWWDDAEWDHRAGRGTRDVIAGRAQAPIDFMSPYPASVLKLMVGFGVLRLVDAGLVDLDQPYAYRPVGEPRPACGGAVTKPVRAFFDEMITVSRNDSTCALLKLLHDHGQLDPLHRTFHTLGLESLRLSGTDPNTGGRWDGSNMNALDTAKLLMLINGGAGVLWTTPQGTAVTREVLSPRSRAFFLSTLHDQGLNQVLSTSNRCGQGYPAPGIPQLVPRRWMDPVDGTVTVEHRRYGQDVRPCQSAAEVRFAHKTGLADTSGNDAGIVTSLPGRPQRHYIVAVHSNLGDRYIDPDRPPDSPGSYPVVHTEKLARLGATIDRLMTSEFPL